MSDKIEMQIIEPIEPSPEMKRKLFARVDADLAERRTQSDAPVFQPVPTEMQARAWFARPRFVLLLFVILALLAIGAWILLSRAG